MLTPPINVRVVKEGVIADGSISDVVSVFIQPLLSVMLIV